MQLGHKRSIAGLGVSLVMSLILPCIMDLAAIRRPCKPGAHLSPPLVAADILQWPEGWRAC